MHGAAAGGNDIAALFRPRSVPAGHDAASLLDDRNQRRNVIGLQPRLDNQIDMA